MQQTNDITIRALRRFEMLDQLDRKLRNGPAIGPVDMRRSIDKIASAMRRAGAVFIDERQVRLPHGWEMVS